ncbi:unnamed protein product [Cylindrotheca closterium]|uniref:Uncharacterized protein n=1 Tax=Cylindrotheca closterium TaxID=2856 RepID=A0AAD2G243_9STRA|nr:unnamed protein product [Cylindrotheca closterium]
MTSLFHLEKSTFASSLLVALTSTSSSESQSSGPSNSACVSPILFDADIRFCFSFFDSFLKEVSFKLRVISAIPRFTETLVGGSFSARPKDRSQYEKRLYSWLSIQWVQTSPMTTWTSKSYHPL